MPDRELDIWLAEHLFGWRNDKFGVLRPGWFVDLEDQGENMMLAPQVQTWSPTGDGMLLVLKAMRGRGFHSVMGHGVQNCYAEFTGDSGTVVEIDDALPRAVAKAAKAALEQSIATPPVGEGAEA